MCLLADFKSFYNLSMYFTLQWGSGSGKISTECGDQLLPPQNAPCEGFSRLALTDSQSQSI